MLFFRTGEMGAEEEQLTVARWGYRGEQRYGVRGICRGCRRQVEDMKNAGYVVGDTTSNLSGHSYELLLSRRRLEISFRYAYLSRENGSLFRPGPVSCRQALAYKARIIPCDVNVI